PRAGEFRIRTGRGGRDRDAEGRRDRKLPAGARFRGAEALAIAAGGGRTGRPAADPGGRAAGDPGGARRRPAAGAQPLQGGSRGPRGDACAAHGGRPGMSAGQPISRIEGRAKVTGNARYASDNNPPNLLHGVFVGSPLGAGRIRAIDASAALKITGVVRVLTRADMPTFGKVSLPAAII